MANKTFIDLFCGCGGFSLGASLAGYTNLLSVDVDPILTSSYKRNFPKSNLQLADLATIENISILLENRAIKPDILIGGPPCQGFSFIGKRNENDPRNELVWHFFRHVKKLKPNIFILENVEGLASGYGLQAISEGISQLPSYYKVSEPIPVNALDFGAATSRPRILIVGYDTRYVDNIDLKNITSFKKQGVNIKEAINDLPVPSKSDDDIFDWVPYKTDQELSAYAIKLRAKPPKNLGWLDAVTMQQKGLVSGMSATVHTPDVIQRFKQTKQGEKEHISRYHRLKWSSHSRTLRAGTGRDKGGFQAARPIHPSQARVITVREAARIQGFPDWFVFHPTKWHSFRMIGNSVSPIMATEILKKI